MKYLLVGIGGMLGCLLRYNISRFLSNKKSIWFPIGTFLVNATGAFLLGISFTLELNPKSYLFVADGFLGAFTTFSTFMYEGFSFISSKKFINAVIYVTVSVIIGFIFFLLGVNVVYFFTYTN